MRLLILAIVLVQKIFTKNKFTYCKKFEQLYLIYEIRKVFTEHFSIKYA